VLSVYGTEIKVILVHCVPTGTIHGRILFSRSYTAMCKLCHALHKLCVKSRLCSNMHDFRAVWKTTQCCAKFYIRCAAAKITQNCVSFCVNFCTKVLQWCRVENYTAMCNALHRIVQNNVCVVIYTIRWGTENYTRVCKILHQVCCSRKCTKLCKILCIFLHKNFTVYGQMAVHLAAA
jgi:hypothetical protein